MIAVPSVPGSISTSASNMCSPERQFCAQRISVRGPVWLPLRSGLSPLRIQALYTPLATENRSDSLRSYGCWTENVSLYRVSPAVGDGCVVAASAVTPRLAVAPAVAQALVERVLTAIAELGFRRNDIARNLRSGRVNATVGLLIEEIANPFYAAIASVAADIAADHKTLLMTASSEEDADRERTLLLELCQRRVDGLLVVPAGEDHSYLRREVEMGMAVVFLDRPPGDLSADTVLLDNRGRARSGAAPLRAAPPHRIRTLLDSLSVYTMRERLAGARDALANAGVPGDEALVRDRVKTPDDAARTVADLPDRPDPPPAFFPPNNPNPVGT